MAGKKRGIGEGAHGFTARIEIVIRGRFDGEPEEFDADEWVLGHRKEVARAVADAIGGPLRGKAKRPLGVSMPYDVRID